MSSTLISVIIPTYNRSDYLPQAVESALGQTGVEVEVIVIDDGSTDDTSALIERKAAHWGERFHYVWQENAERSAARNHGLRYARGEFVAFLDSDDVWREGHAQSCLAALQDDSTAAAAYAEYGLIAADGRVINDYVARPQGEGQSFLRDLCLKRLILHPTEVIVRRSALGTGDAFDPEISVGEDWLLWVRLAQTAAFRRTGEPTVWMRIHPKGTFGDPLKFTRSLLLAAEKVISTGLPAELGINGKRILAINRTHCAYAHYLSGHSSEARRLLMSALREYPAILKEADAWRVLGRLLAGDKLSRRIRARRQRGRGAVVGADGGQQAD
ncbi:MAG TPA: glycosyltransferase family 2 protein [Pyrinomonadaceae bacterium]|nr:glycosyltransferase family 2 protein [Pyrinomonadaceae bacterium]